MTTSADLMKPKANSPIIEEQQQPILVLACGALAREILSLIEINQWQGIKLECLPANLHLFPDRIPAAVERAVEKFRAKYSRIFVAYADCGTGGALQRTCQSLGVEMIEGPHCYAFFDGLEEFAERSENEITAFYLTDFLVRQFDAFVWRALGLDAHPELRDIYFGNYTKLIFLAQTEDKELDRKAQECAARLGLFYERRYTGYGDLSRILGGLSRSRQLEHAPRE